MGTCHHPNIIAQECGQTLGLGLGQSKDIVVVLLLVYNGQRDRRARDLEVMCSPIPVSVVD